MLFISPASLYLPSRDALASISASRKRDLTSRVVLIRTAATRPEAADHLTVASIRIWDPRQSPTRETDFAEVRADLEDLPRRFPNVEKILVDEGAEAGSVLPFARSHAALAGRVEGFTASVKHNLALWAALAARLHARTLSIPRQERLIGELRGLRQESFSFGSKWRIVDSSRKFHRDISLALAGACFAAGEAVNLGGLDKGIMSRNLAAPAATAALAANVYGERSGGLGLSHAFGRDGAAFDMGRAFGE